MKKHLFLLTVFFSLFISNVFSQTVYITKTGKKYHSENCRHLSKSSYSINLADAKAKGFDACSVCNPSSTVNNTTASKTTSTQSQTTNKESQTNNPPTKEASQSVQCSATTKAGKQCSRMTKSANGKCWQHGGN